MMAEPLKDSHAELVPAEWGICICVCVTFFEQISVINLLPVLFSKFIRFKGLGELNVEVPAIVKTQNFILI